MSLNLYIAAKKGNMFEEFPVVQTSTNVSASIFISKDAISTYKEYLKKTYSSKLAEDHIKSLDEWIIQKTKDGYEIIKGIY